MMKSYKEMSESVLKSINEHNIKKNTRKEILKRAIPLGCLCIALIGGGIFWNINGYHHSAPVNTNGENQVTTLEDNDLMHTSAVHEEYNPIPNDSYDQKVYKWICSRYKDEALYYTYTGFDSFTELTAANAEAQQYILNSMSEAERKQWENRLNFLNIENIFSLDEEAFLPRQDLWEMNIDIAYIIGYRTVFELYKNEEDCRNGKQATSDDVEGVEEGMIMKVYFAEPYKQPDEPPSPDDVPYILHDIGIFESTTVGELKDRLYFIDREDIKIYEIILVDINSDPPSTRISELTDDGENFKDAYGIYIEYTYLGEVYAIDFYSVDYYPNSSIRRIFQWSYFALKSEFPFRSFL